MTNNEISGQLLSAEYKRKYLLAQVARNPKAGPELERLNAEIKELKLIQKLRSQTISPKVANMCNTIWPR